MQGTTVEEEGQRRAQKLQSLGQLSAGIAHELNTPMQFISDNLELLRKGFDGVQALLDALAKVHAAAVEGAVPTALLDAVMEAERDARWSYYAARMGRAFARAGEGVDRVRHIVGAMKVFSHPQNHLAPVDLNRAIALTLTVANPELRHVARVTTDFGTLPSVMGYPDDLNQVFLNLIVNAAHAIADTKRAELGTIAIRTRASSTHAEIEISDTGGGIPAAIRERVYDPFFTTKEPGRGTGQGLALAHTVVVDRHRGRIHFETGPAGTTFHIAIPLSQLEEHHV
jgi:two-component system NtrC family sensor kinase